MLFLWLFFVGCFVGACLIEMAWKHHHRPRSRVELADQLARRKRGHHAYPPS